MSESIWPVTIISDRYGGTYSRGKWIAWNLEEEHVPWEPLGGDPEADVFWWEYHENGNPNNLKVGLGKTPNEAFEDLKTKLNN